MSERLNNVDPDRDAFLIIKGVMISCSVFLAVVVIVFERWLYVKCRKKKYKQQGILTKGFVNMKKPTVNGKSLMTFYNMEIEFLVQSMDKTRLFIIYCSIKLMPKVEYMIEGWDHSHEINVRYIPNIDNDLKKKLFVW